MYHVRELLHGCTIFSTDSEEEATLYLAEAGLEYEGVEVIEADCPYCFDTGAIWCHDENQYEPCDCKSDPDTMLTCAVGRSSPCEDASTATCQACYEA